MRTVEERNVWEKDKVCGWSRKAGRQRMQGAEGARS